MTISKHNRYWCSMTFVNNTLITYSDIKNNFRVFGIFITVTDFPKFLDLLFLRRLHVNWPTRIPVTHIIIKTTNDIEKFIEVSEIYFKTRLKYEMKYYEDNKSYITSITRGEFLEHLRPYLI